MTNYIASTFSPKKGNKYFFDTNIWYFLHGIYGSDDIITKRKADIYSRLYAKILIKKCLIYTCVEQINELAHSISRRYLNNFNDERTKNGEGKIKIKEFKKNPFFGIVITNIKYVISEIMKDVEVINSGCTIDKILDDFLDNMDSLEINDQIFKSICINNGLFLVSDDSGFTSFSGTLMLIK